MSGGVGSVITLVIAVIALGVGAPRWLRLSQREHYLPGGVSRFALRWWTLLPWNPLIGALVVASLGIAVDWTPSAALAAVLATVAPIGLSLRGRSSPLVWTARLRTLAATAFVVATVVVGAVAVAGWRPAAWVACAVVVVAPLVVDSAALLTRPIERRRLAPFLRQASDRLRQVSPTVVAITGSYGKTTTKGYVAHLLSGSRVVFPSPRSFNNRAGLATAVNAGLAPGTEVFVAEMGTYGPGEIAELCKLIPPDIAVITAIGPVHLERMGSEERIAQAKAEILERAPVAVLNVDHPLLAALADRAAAEGKKVWRCSAQDAAADVRVRAVPGAFEVELGGVTCSIVGVHAAATNVACAIAVALELGVAPELVARRLQGLPVAEHRQTVTTGQRGQSIIDDTYNANPAGAAAAVALVERLGAAARRRVLVTPGMVELGSRQAEANRQMVVDAAAVMTHLVIVGATNAPALRAGAHGTALEVVRVRHRSDAVAWVSANTEAGDVVLYENDLPDHFA
jgi:UDP-N-acetylmuramoyl-tripeptide--D-alanyl-D-alanine ligase